MKHPYLHFFQDLPIRRKLVLVTLLTCSAALGLACAALFWFQSIQFRKGFTTELQSLGAVIAQNGSAPLTFQDKKSAVEVLSALKVQPHITSACLFDDQGNLFAHFGVDDDSKQIRLSGSHSAVTFADGYGSLLVPVMDGSTRLGTLHLRARFQDKYRALLSLYALVMAGVLAGSLLVILLLSSFMKRLIANPIVALAEVAQEISDREDYSRRAPESGRDEVGRLTRTFNRMLDQIQSREKQMEQLNLEIREASRRAGMAEVATGVLHNVGNVLNSVNVSANLISNQVQQSQTGALRKLSGLLDEHRADLGTFLTTDPKGKRVPEFLCQLARLQEEEKETIGREIEALVKNVEHIKQIVAMQQSYAKVAGVIEDLPVPGLVEDALRLNQAAFVRHGVTIKRQFEPVPTVRVDMHKVLQILVNLFRNAKYAMDSSGRDDKVLTLGIAMQGTDRVRVVVQDNGVGIPPENLTRIFGHGFTTKKDGHGFGLHSGALAAKEMGGSLQALSDGLGTGATFILELPTGAATSAVHDGEIHERAA